MPGIDDTRQFIPVRIAVLTVSDTRTPTDDRSGTILVERIEAAGHVLAGRAICTDDVEKIRDEVRLPLVPLSSQFNDTLRSALREAGCLS